MEEKMMDVMNKALDKMSALLKEKELTEQVQAELSILNRIATNAVFCENMLLREQLKSLSERNGREYPLRLSASKRN